MAPGTFRLLPLLTGEHRAEHGEILRQVTAIVEAGHLRPRMHSKTFGFGDLAAAYDVVRPGADGKVVIAGSIG